MALGSNTIWEVRTTGSDTANGGAFDPGQTAGMFTDGAATVATGNSPVFTSASYNFVAGDVNAWIYVASGTHWQPGWYKIASVAANAATLSAAIGAALWASPYATATYKIPSLINTIAGCSSDATATLSGATWSIDYSQQAAAQFTYTDLASAGAGLTVSSAAFPFAKQQVGNSIVITGGTNFTAGRYVIASVAAGVATVVGPGNITSGVGASGTGGQGGAVATPGLVAGLKTAGNDIFILSGTYSCTTASTNVASGMVSDGTGGVDNTNISRWEGYGSLRKDRGTKPLLQASGAISTFTMFTCTSNFFIVDNIAVDGALKTSSKGFAFSVATCVIIRCKASNCTNSGIVTSGIGVSTQFCEVTGCTTVAAFKVADGYLAYSWSHDNTGVDGFALTSNVNYTTVVGCISSNNGAKGFNADARQAFFNCTAYQNTGDGFTWANTNNGFALNCIAYLNGAYGFNCSAASTQEVTLQNCATGSNTSGATNNITSISIGAVLLTADPFTSAAGNDYSLNTTAGGGAACRAAGYPGAFPGATSTGYLDIGSVQHADPAGGAAGMLYVPNLEGI